MPKSLKASLLVSVAPFVFALGVSAAAQEETKPAEQPAAEQPAAEEVKDERVVVTAAKRAQYAQDVPASIAAIGGADIARKGINELSDYITAVPGISYDFSQGPTGARGRQTVGIRGLSRFSGLTANTVGFYIDETPIDIANPDIFDLNRIEVLRGPQGTLYGAGSVGGTIKLITNQPDPSRFAFALDGGLSQVADGDLGGRFNQMINLPLVEDMAALRAVGSIREEAGWIDNYNQLGVQTGEDINSGGGQGARAAILIQPTSALKITPSVMYHRLAYDSEQNFVVGVPGLPERAKNEFLPTESEEEFILAGVTVGYNFGAVELVSQTSFYDYRNESQEDTTLQFTAALPGLNFLPIPVNSVTNEQAWVHESRLVSNFEGPFQFIAGVYYEDTARPFTSQSLIENFNATLGFALLPVTPLGDNYYVVRSTRDQTQFAAFGEATYTFFEDLDVTGGLRYFKFESDTTDAFSGYAFTGVPALQPGHAEEDGVNPKATIAYRAGEDSLIYATASRGFRPGNANIPLPASCNASLIAAGITPPASTSFDSDSVWNYETGFKTEWLDGGVAFSAAAFYMDWKDMQVGVPLPSCRIQGFIVNAGDARSVGAEIELSARPIDGLSLNVAGSYMDSELTEDSTVLASASGTDLLFIPHWTWSGSAQYTFAVGGATDAYLRGDVKYRDQTNLNYAGTSQTDSYAQIDLRAGLEGEMGDSSWEAAIFVENLTDEMPILSRDPRPVLGGDTVTSIEPRKIGIGLTISY